uniref:Uncharacterized protein n=1 Tax=Arundo donax TaxID=35708 RepID=A0A0A9DJR7_ARUDO
MFFSPACFHISCVLCEPVMLALPVCPDCSWTHM